ncbi:unnamed protein product [Enterobius vermicularis]|uniref:Transport and Golgi organization protein 2 homolog n=1 Tax=Enterobius vermicularis TaxID=51028 RepID=A0A0N4UWG2_ENTVE|nr:unnamed protein product [Enterobius vermicularis]
MCVTFVYLNADAVDEKDYQLIVINNRDESYDRPTSYAAWEDGILAGKDEGIPNERGGTWLGVTKGGKVGVLLSMLQKQSTLKPNAPTRGRILNGYFKSKDSAAQYTEKLAQSANKFNCFNLVLLDRYTQRLLFWTEILTLWVYGFGNSPRSHPFRKVEHGTELFKECNEDQLLLELVNILRNDICHHPDNQLLSQTEQQEECSKAMSQLFYSLPGSYRYGRAVFYEVSLYVPALPVTAWATTKLQFTIDD